jgi:transposase
VRLVANLKLSREEFQVIYDQGADAVYALVEGLMSQINLLAARVQQLENQINTNSRNSGKPPSSDAFVKPKSLRKKSGKKGGAQKGHPGHTLVMTDQPDRVETHQVTHCHGCGACLADEEVESIERRQIVDLPPLKLETTEHRAEQKTCHICGAKNKAAFPAGVNQPVQYGPLVKSLAVYLNQYQFIPYDRVEELFKDLFGQPFSEGSLFTANQICYEALEGTEQEIRQQILNEPVVNYDETGARVEGKLHWLHVAGTSRLTSYSIHQKRGSEAMDAMGILPYYTGVAKHDCLHAYFKYLNCSHSLCNAHHLRELTWVFENLDQVWARQMYELLLDAKRAVDDAKENSKTSLELEQLSGFLLRYDSILALGYKENPFYEVWPPPKGRRGRLKRTKPRNLLVRLKKYRTETLNFLFDFNIDFDNNQALHSSKNYSHSCLIAL